MVGMGFAPTNSDELGYQGGTNVRDNVVYQMRLTAFDGGILGDNQGSSTCQFRFLFLTDPLVKFPGAEFQAVTAAGLESPLYSFSPYVISDTPPGRNGNAQVWNNPQNTIFPIDDQGEANWGSWQQSAISPKLGTFVGNIQVLFDRVKISVHKVFIKKDATQTNAPNTTPARRVVNNFVLTKPLADGSLPSFTSEAFADILANPDPSNFDKIQFVIGGAQTIPNTFTYSSSTIELAANYGVGDSTNFGILLNVLDLGDINSLEGPATLDANITVQVQLKAELVP